MESERDSRAARSVSGEQPVAPRREPTTARDGPELPSPRDSTDDVRSIDLARGLASDATFVARYDPAALLGEGGMGAVMLCRDRSIGRDVAVKVLREDASAEATERFVQEARTQGQLEHPSIVPVHEVGSTAEGRPFFTMRRVRGKNLAEIIEALRRRDPDAIARHSRRKLLTAFASVCLTIDFAHSRGVVHRDLKPSNVMLGEFGEVQVLDWGLAKRVGESELPVDTAALARTLPGETGDCGPRTEIGAVLGTPGYMAPEQLEGDPSRISPRTDVYSLGAILFEILTLHPLYETATLPQVVDAARRGIETRPSRRYPDADVPPELEAAIVHATATDPGQRYASARELAEAVERYLDGDRDVARRRELASQAIARAERAVERGSPEAMTAAIAEAARAVALDPESDAALGLLANLLVELPSELPAEAARELERRQARARSDTARIGMGAFMLRLAFFPLIALMGVRAWGLAGFILALLAGSVALAFWLWRRRATELWHGALLLGVSTLSIVLIGSAFGSYLLVPPMILMNNITFALHAGPRLRRLIMVLGALAVLVPLGLEFAGVVPPAYAFADGKLLVLPRLVDFPPLMTLTLLTLSTVALVTLPVVFFGRARDALAAAERRLFHQAWHLRHLVPERIRRALAKTDPGDPTR